MNARVLGVFGVCGLLGGCASPSTPTGPASPPRDDANNPVEGGPLAGGDGPRRLHHLVGMCALDEAGALWCYDRRAEPPQADWFDGRRTGWLRRVPDIPRMTTLAPWPAGRGMCGLGDKDGSVVCITESDQVHVAQAPGGVDRVAGDIVISKTGQRYFTATPLVDGAVRFELQPLVPLASYAQVIPQSTGWFAIGATGSKLLQATGDRRTLDESLAADAEALPQLDGWTDVQSVAQLDSGDGCALRAEGRIECWTAEGGATSRPHAASGAATALVAASLGDGSAGVCASTPDRIICEDFSEAGETLTLPVRGARELSAPRGALCMVSGDGRGIACMRTALRQHAWIQVPLPGAARSFALTDRGACAVTEAGALVCWGDPFSGPLPSGAPEPEQPYGEPTIVESDGVTAFRFGPGHGWCHSSADRTRCESRGIWNTSHTADSMAAVVELTGHDLCLLEGGTVRCPESSERYQPALEAAIRSPAVDAFGLSPNGAHGCLARGREVTCWDKHEEPADFDRFTMPAPVQGFALGISDLYLWLADGRVAHASNPDKAREFAILADLRVTAFHPTRGGWCGIDDDDIVCAHGSDVHTKRWPGAVWADIDASASCILDAQGALFCSGSQELGKTGHGWSPNTLAWIPTQRGQALRDLRVPSPGRPN